MPISMHLERRPAEQILNLWVLRRQLVWRDFLVGCFALPEVVGEGLKSSIPNLFFPESGAIVFPTLPHGLTRNLFRAPDFAFPPSIVLLPSPNPFANDIARLHIVTRCLPTHLSSVCSSAQACPVLPAPLFLLTQGKVCVWAGEGRWVSPTAPRAGAQAARAAARRQCSWEDTITRGDWQLPLPVWHWQMTLQGQQPWASPQTLADIMG